MINDIKEKRKNDIIDKRKINLFQFIPIITSDHFCVVNIMVMTKKINCNKLY